VLLIRLLSPVPPPFPNTSGTAGALPILAALLVARINLVGNGMLGVSARGLPLQLLIGMSGLFIGLVQYLILRPPPLLEVTGWILLFVWPLVFLLLSLNAVLEEFIFRGLIQYSALRSLGWFGLVFSAVLYASLFLGYYSLLNLFFVFFVGLLYGTTAYWFVLGVYLCSGQHPVSCFPLMAPFFQGAMAGGSLPTNTRRPPSHAFRPDPCPPPRPARHQSAGCLTWWNLGIRSNPLTNATARP
jgi:membrane protease YdiL (CAAX protease family)